MLIINIQVLVIHPDHLFRDQILSLMQQQWIPPSIASKHHIIAGLVRDGQLELAMQQVANHDPWLHVTILHALCAASDFPAVQQFLYVLEDHRIELSSLTWLLVLESASKSLDLDVVRYIWTRLVEPRHLIPPTEICYDALLVASRQADVRLAESVVEVLVRRESEHKDKHGLSEVVWKMLSEAYENAGDRKGPEKIAYRRDESRR
jgi:hypothetical protein